MPAASGSVHEVEWHELFPGLLLFRAVRSAAEIPKLLLAVAGLLLMWLGWWAVGQLYISVSSQPLAADEPLAVQIDSLVHWPSTPASVPSAAQLAGHDVSPWWQLLYPGPFLGSWSRISAPAVALFSRATDLKSLGFLILAIVWTVAVWALFGGAISRIAVVQLGRGERVGLVAALRFARRKWTDYFAAPLMPLVVVGGILLLLAPLGLLLRSSAVGALIAAVLFPLALVVGIAMTVLAVGLLFGWPLMWASVSAEAGDSFSALSNAYAYTFQRSRHYAGYALWASLLGAAGWGVLHLLAATLLYLTAWAVGWSSGQAAAPWSDMLERVSIYSLAGARPAQPEPTAAAADRATDPVAGYATATMRVWERLLAAGVAGYGLSFFWTASTGIYLLLRSSLDGTETRRRLPRRR